MNILNAGDDILAEELNENFDLPLNRKFGNGSDGDVAFDGSNTFAFATKVGSTYTLTRDIQGTTITVSNGVVIETASYAIYASILLTNNGTIRNNGGAGGDGSGGAGQGNTGVGGLAGTATPTGTFAPSKAGKTGGDHDATGTNGENANPSLGVAGVNSGSGQTGGTVTLENLYLKQDDSITANTETELNWYRIFPVGSVSFKLLSPSAGSASGNGGVSSNPPISLGGGGGGSGASGGIMYICARTLTNNGTIETKGGKGGNGGNISVTSSNGGDGAGGGSGGVMVLVYETITVGTISVAGGAKGTGGTSTFGSAGSDGQDGGTGKYYRVKLVIA